MRPIVKGSTDQSVVIRIVDSTDGTPETGVVFNTSGIDLWYRREGAAKTSITEAALSALTDAHSDGGILHIGDGYYRLDLPDAAVATGANGVAVGGTVTGMVVIGCYVPLWDANPYDGVRLGLTALPNAAAEAAGGLFTRGSGAGQIAQDANGRVSVNVVAYGGSAGTFASGRPEVNTTHAAGTAWGSGAITAASIASDAITAAKLAADAGAEIGAAVLSALGTGSWATSLAPAATALSTAQWTNTRAGYLDNVNNATLAGASFPSDPADESLVIAATDAVMSRLGAPAGASIAADIATRLASASYTAPPSAATVASAVRTELSTELGRVDVAVSTRLAPTTAGRTLDVTATGAAGIDWANVEGQGTVVTLSGTTVGTVEEIGSDVTLSAGERSAVASAVRTELSTELGRIDAAVTTRQATFTASTSVTFPAGFGALTITSGIVSADVKKVNAVTLTGNGTSGTPWGPA